MSCDRTESLLHAYFDNELDPLPASEFEHHLPLCLDCTQALEDLRALRSTINDSQLYQQMPNSLRSKLTRRLRSSKQLSFTPVHAPWKWLALAATFLLAITTWQLLSHRRLGNGQSLLVASSIDAHLRSLQPGHLTDVISSDQHTVKPWFAGKLDFAPPVRDFSDQGFPLQGGRLDVLQGRTIAALVYGRHNHLVSVFIWPAVESDAAVHSGSQNGYQWIQWQKDRMEFCAVSDASSSDLDQLQQLFSQP